MPPPERPGTAPGEGPARAFGPLTVLHVTTGLGSGGSERMLTRIVLAQRGAEAPRHVVVSLMDEGVFGRSLRDAGVELHCLGMRGGVPSPTAIFRLARIMSRQRPDVVMSWLYHADLLATLAAPLAGVKRNRLIWNLRCSDLDVAKYKRTLRWIVAGLARLSCLPAAVSHNSLAGRRSHTALGYRPKRWAYLPNGFDLAHWAPDEADRAAVRAEWGVACATVVVGMVARVDPMKDHATFLNAACRLQAAGQDVHFVLVGKGTESLDLPASLAGRVRALGERRDIERLLRGLDILVLSSSEGEGFPNAVGEAMATCVPCVVTDAGDAAMVVGDTGRVVPPRAPAALAEAIADLAAEPPEGRADLGRLGRRRIAREFSLERISELYAILWYSVADAAADGQCPAA